MMVQICLERFPPGTIEKLHAGSVGPFQILKKLDDNVYIIDFPKDFGIGSKFNVENLVDYKDSNFNPNNPMVDEPESETILESHTLPPLSYISPNTTYEVDKIINDEIIAPKMDIDGC